uniref:Ethylene receptor n=1 Tax=Gongylonema pulchrum TaxID=637853 RepID=A0A183EIK7_9BILA
LRILRNDHINCTDDDEIVNDLSLKSLEYSAAQCESSVIMDTAASVQGAALPEEFAPLSMDLIAMGDKDELLNRERITQPMVDILPICELREFAPLSMDLIAMGDKDELLNRERITQPMVDILPICELRGPICMELERCTKKGERTGYVVEEKINLVGTGTHDAQRIFAVLRPFMRRTASSVSRSAYFLVRSHI